jgi:NADH:ubiquinone oxidoreductase subunit C
MSFLKDAAHIREQGGRLVSLSGQRQGDEVRLLYHFELGGELRTLELCTDKRSAPSLFSTFPNADLPERQAAQYFQVKFVGHPNLTLSEAGS